MPGEADCHLLPFHCLDVAAAGIEYLRRSPSLRAFFMNAFRIQSESVLEGWLGFWLILHDVGKFSEAFQSQRPELFERMRGRAPSPAKAYQLRHDSLGMLFWKQALIEHAIDEEWFGPNADCYEDGLHYLMRAVTGHHGQPPNEDGLWERHFDTVHDRRAALDFVSDVRTHLFGKAIAGIPACTGPEAFYQASKELSWWLAGVAVLADWLGSNTDFFAYWPDTAPPVSLAEYWAHAGRQAVEAVDAAGVIGPGSKHPLDFVELFPGIAAPSPLQIWATTVELQEGPQVHILEDVTGAGKTEAAVMLAHRLMEHGQVDGFFIGLPTMATANAMYGRISQVYRLLFNGQASLVLAHGQRQLVEKFAESIVPAGAEEHDPRQADDTATARCTAWLADHNKRALLAPAGVGTIDQALISVLHSKHQCLRLLGLFGKVLVVDEVHACDAYMQRLLEVLLEFHARAGGSAILLSATLPQQMKRSLLDAYARGRRLSAPAISAPAYPLVTSWAGNEAAMLAETGIATRDDVRRALDVHYVTAEADVLAVIEEALDAGRCICWMRNTVADAMSAHALFQGRLPPEKLILFHARFTLHDRLRTERKVLTLFGKRSTPQRRAGRLVIATQVAEQSLDADWDIVISDLAPVDRLIQRAGRLQRHPRDRRGRRLHGSAARDQRGTPCLWVLGPQWTDNPSELWFRNVFPKAAGVYPNHGQLWLTAKVLQRRTIDMPGDARELIEQVFGKDVVVPTGLQRNADAATGAVFGNASLAQQNTVKLDIGYQQEGLDWWSDAKTTSRLGEATIDVLLARWEGGRLRPWARQDDFQYGWAYSTVRAAERLIARAADQPDPLRKAEVDRLLLSLPNRGQWVVLLPLEQTLQGWVGEAWNRPANTEDPTKLKWVYDPQIGLRQLENKGKGET